MRFHFNHRTYFAPYVSLLQTFRSRLVNALSRCGACGTRYLSSLGYAHTRLVSGNRSFSLFGIVRVNGCLVAVLTPARCFLTGSPGGERSMEFKTISGRQLLDRIRSKASAIEALSKVVRCFRKWGLRTAGFCCSGG